MFKVRASAAGKLMTNARSKTETLSETTKSYLQDYVREQIYGFRKEITSKYLTKGIDLEDKAIDKAIEWLDLDFAIIPLADDTSFNDFKSELKMMEFAALKVPMIVKDQLPYSPYIEGNAIGYKTPQDLEGAIERLIKNPGQKDMVKSAYKWVSEKRNVDLLAPDLIKLYASLLPEKTREKIQTEPIEESK